MNIKIKNNKYLYDICLKLIVVIDIVLFIVLPLKSNIIVSLCIHLNIMIYVLCAIYYVMSCIIIRKDKMIHLYIGLILLVFISIQFGGLSLNHIILGINFLAIPTFICIVPNINDIRCVKKWICVSCMINAIVYIVLSMSKFRQVGYNKWGTYATTLSLGYNNPNETAMYILVNIFLLVYLRLNLSKTVRKRLVDLFIFVHIYFLWETESRTSLFVLLIVSMLYAIYHFFKIKNWHITCMLLVPLLYLLLSLGNSFAKKIILKGDDLFTGRDKIYLSYFQNSDWVDIIIGNFREYPFVNLHNGYISIIATIGIIGFGLFFIILLKALCTRKAKIYTNAELWIYCSLLGIIFETSTEAAFIISGSVFANSVGLLLVLLVNPEEKKDAKIINIRV